MSWRTGAGLFWEMWPKIKEALPDLENRTDFTRSQLKLFLDWDVDPGDLVGEDPEIDQLMKEIDPDL
jgi:hypothetical protein